MLCHRGVSDGCFAAEVRCFATKVASPAGGSLRLLRWGRMLGRRMVALPLRTRLRLGWSSRLLKWRRMLGRRLVRFATEDASPAGLVVEVEEVGTDAWPSVVLSVAAPNTAGYLGVELFFLFLA
ncbi:hypothetical protein BDA96_02G441800 [Sorghum bicolor]|uniref:Uncharacterized protein n=2 Tax=Sorghum bicolor TaxID=4558 RepID=A0A921UWT0_SORBI|nr:hypothetical protein BDA96_02G441800 [Sorghum bicolor]OQU90490.1 hypothetical protein SORBI_3002G421501 [Sorghum bicolor]